MCNFPMLICSRHWQCVPFVHAPSPLQKHAELLETYEQREAAARGYVQRVRPGVRVRTAKLHDAKVTLTIRLLARSLAQVGQWPPLCSRQRWTSCNLFKTHRRNAVQVVEPPVPSRECSPVWGFCPNAVATAGLLKCSCTSFCARALYKSECHVLPDCVKFEPAWRASSAPSDLRLHSTSGLTFPVQGLVV